MEGEHILVKSCKAGASIAAAVLDTLSAVAQISTGSDTGRAAIDPANEFFPVPIRKEDQK